MDRDQADGLDTCRHCGCTSYGDGDAPRCPECGRRLDAECVIIKETAGSIRDRTGYSHPLSFHEQAEVVDGRWIIVDTEAMKAGHEYGEREAAEYEAAWLDRLAGYMLRKGISFK